MTVTVQLGERADVTCRSLSGEERLGAPTRLEVTVSARAPLAAAEVLGQPASITIATRHGQRTILGVVTRFTAVGTARTSPEREYRLAVCSRLAVLELRRRSRIYQRLTVPEIVKKVLEEGGYLSSNIRMSLVEEHAPRPYVVQYAETDLAFVRRLCEEEGLHFFFPCEAGDTAESIAIVDHAGAAEPATSAPLPLVDDAHLAGEGPSLFSWRTTRRRRPGKVTLRDHDHERPRVPLEATSEAGEGTPLEKEHAVYEAPGRFRDAKTGALRARIRLESLRAEAIKSSFSSNAPGLAPGLALSVHPGTGYRGPPPPAEQHLIVAVCHGGAARQGAELGPDHHRIEVEAIPLDVPFRLPRITPRPRIHGLQSAVVTGPEGSEIHPDALGRVTVRFHWDTEGPQDHGSSIPIRTLQPNTPGSMLLPRVGWEVLVAFEDGDPDRPYVIGRSYNGKMLPPFPLPANKTMTVLATHSSPGAGGTNLISFDDAAGRQHMSFQATFGKSTSVAGDMFTQTAKNERHSVTGSQTRSVGASETISVGQALFDTLGSQSGTVGAVHDVTSAGHIAISVGSESVTVGGALVEEIGDPVKGAVNLATSAALHGIGSRGTAGMIASTALGIAKAAAEGYGQKTGGGMQGAANAAKTAAAGVLMSFLPGGDAIMSGVTGAAKPAPWDQRPADEGEAAPGGGAGGGASDASGPGGPGPGHRNVVAKGTGFVGIGGTSAIATPGSITWTTLGTSTHSTAASRSIQAASVTRTTGGLSIETLGGGHTITASGKIGRGSAILASMDVGGALSASGASYSIGAPKVTLKVAGPLTMNGANVTFKVPGASLGASPGGLVLEASTIEITGVTSQSGGMAHR